MKRKVILIGMCVLLFVTACDSGSDTSQSDSPSSGNTTISSKYWGTWIQMDTGDEYYIDDQTIYEISGSSKRKIQSGISGYTLDESQLVLKKGSTVYFRKGGKTRSFKASFSGFASSGEARAVGTGSQSISGRRQNKNNAADSETFTATTNGEEVNFENSVAGDLQQITVDGSDTSASFTPQYDGENVGTIPVVESGRYAFKTTYEVSNADKQGMMYGNLLGKYEISFNFTNVGSAMCSTSVYEISWDDNNLRSDDIAKSGNFNSIEPGKSKSVEGTFYYYGSFTDEYKDVKVNIKIQDSGYGETWNDSVVLRFYRGYVNLKVNAMNFNSSSSANLKGFLIYPDGRSKWFKVSSGSTYTVPVPWSESDYYVVLSGATSETEMGYSFGMTTADLSGTWGIDEINAHEPNDSIAQAASVSDLTKPVKAYLKVNDLDYYKINVSSLPCKEGGIAYAGYRISDDKSLGTLNNGDGSINTGETVAFDVAVQNTSSILLENVTVAVSSTSQYATLTGGSANYGNITDGCYQTGSYKKWSPNSNGYGTIYYSSMSYYPFRLTVSESCPIGTKIPIALRMTDVRGREWTDTFSITVQ